MEEKGNGLIYDRECATSDLLFECEGKTRKTRVCVKHPEGVKQEKEESNWQYECDWINKGDNAPTR